MARYLQAAFDQVCSEAREPEPWHVSLVEEVPYYGGPEEGGWWGSDTHVVASQEFPSEAAARAAAGAVEKLAKELESEAWKAHGDQCVAEMEWLESRGLDADFLPEPDGPTRYHVVVGRGIPQESRGPRQYS